MSPERAIASTLPSTVHGYASGVLGNDAALAGAAASARVSRAASSGRTCRVIGTCAEN